MRAVYKLANFSGSLPLLITNIMRSLFLSLKDDSLVFLMGIVVRSLDVIEERGMCFAALRHAAAFLAAHPNVDFQTILPALIIAMQGADSRTREAALDCVTVMATNDKSLSSVYGFDTIYGDGSGTCRSYISWIHNSNPAILLQPTCNTWVWWIYRNTSSLLLNPGISSQKMANISILSMSSIFLKASRRHL
jgi:hypothetical protein